MIDLTNIYCNSSTMSIKQYASDKNVFETYVGYTKEKRFPIVRRFNLKRKMEEQLLPIGIDSEIEHVKSEIDRIDAIFTVATGPMGHQEVNYHIIDEARDYHVIQHAIPHIISITESVKQKSSLKSLSTPLQYQHTDDVIESEKPNISQEDPISTKSSQNFTSDEDDKKGRFSLPEISNPYQSERTCHIKKDTINARKLFQQEQSTSNVITNVKNKQTFSSMNESTLPIPEHCRPNVNNILQQQAELLLPFYTLNELAQHNDLDDAWICIFSHIYDITSLIKKTHSTMAYQQLIDYAGQDISFWFDEQTHEPRQRIDPQTSEPVSVMKSLSIIETLGTPFWQTNDFLIGRLTIRPRYIRLTHNFSPKHPYLLEVAEEETIGQIAKKFLKSNSHIFSYIWQYNGQILDFNKTLTENGIPNEESFHDQYGRPSDNENCPTILLYFSDDLTIA